MMLPLNRRATQQEIELRRRELLADSMKRLRAPEKRDDYSREPAGKPRLILLQGGKKMETGKAPVLLKQAPARRPRGNAEAIQGMSAERGRRMGQVVPIKLEQEKREQGRMLGVMAAMGPLVWAGHLALDWLRSR